MNTTTNAASLPITGGGSRDCNFPSTWLLAAAWTMGINMASENELVFIHLLYLIAQSQGDPSVWQWCLGVGPAQALDCCLPLNPY